MWLKNVLVLLLLSPLVVSCALKGDGTSVPYEFSMDGIKLISPAIVDNNDPSAYGQNSYPIDPTHRLLVRFENLSEEAAQVDTTKPVQVQLTLTDPAQDALAGTDLKLCPLSMNWMMLATWSWAYPFGPSGRWTDGGEFDQNTCMTRIPPGAPPTLGVLVYDILSWFHDYPQGRSVNYGFVVISDSQLITIYGDGSQANSPRILLNKIVEGSR